jgi:hypothetical protein
LYSLSTTSSLVPPWNGILSPLSLKPAYTVSGVQWHKRGIQELTQIEEEDDLDAASTRLLDGSYDRSGIQRGRLARMYHELDSAL